VCDRQTDGQNHDSQDRASIAALCGKKIRKFDGPWGTDGQKASPCQVHVDSKFVTITNITAIAPFLSYGNGFSTWGPFAILNFLNWNFNCKYGSEGQYASSCKILRQ